MEDKKLLGRVATVINNSHNEKHNEKVMFFGFLDFVDNIEVSKKLLNTVIAKENGMDRLRGPVNPSTNYEAACLVDGFDDPPQIMMTYNPKYIKNTLKNLGMLNRWIFLLTPDTSPTQ